MGAPATVARIHDALGGPALFEQIETAGSSAVAGLGSFDGVVAGTGAEKALDDATIAKLEAGTLAVESPIDGSAPARGTLAPVRSAVNGLLFPPDGPVLATSPRGSFLATLARDRETFALDVDLDQLSGAPTAVHLHKGRPSEPGPVFQTLTLEGGTRARFTMKARDAFVFYSSVMTGAGEDLYVDLHTAAHPDGELVSELASRASW